MYSVFHFICKDAGTNKINEKIMDSEEVFLRESRDCAYYLTLERPDAPQ